MPEHEGLMGHGRVVVDPFATALNHEIITGLSSAKGLTAATFEGADFAIIQAQDQDVRWWPEGDDPTAAEGIILAAGQSINYYGSLADIRFFEVTASAKLAVAYFTV